MVYFSYFMNGVYDVNRIKFFFKEIEVVILIFLVFKRKVNRKLKIKVNVF